MRRAVTAAAVAVVALLASGCGEEKRSSPKPPTTRPPAPTSSATTTTTPPPTSTTTACQPPAGAGTTKREGGRPSGIMLLTDVSASGDGCVDRLTFTFRDDRAEQPGYRVEYQPRESALIEDGSGKRLQAEGDAFLVVRIDPAATADLSGSELVFTYKGPRRFKPAGTSHVRELVKSGDFESVVTWAVGLDARRPFAVSTTGSPPRLVVEIG
jgi:hypothetical protein